MIQWERKDKGLEAILAFKDFSQAFAFMTQVAFEAEKMNHHPDWTNSYNKVHIILRTHQANGKITEKDEILAKKIERIFSSFVIEKDSTKFIE